MVVTIAGQRLAVRSVATESYVRTLAGHVDARFREQLGSNRVPAYNTAVLAAMGMADELFRERAERRSLVRKVRERTERILRALDGAVEGTEEEEAT